MNLIGVTAPNLPKFMSVAFGVLLLAGCAAQPTSLSSAGSTAPVATQMARSGWIATYADDPSVAAATRNILSRELDADTTVRLMFLTNTALQRRYLEYRIDPARIAEAATRSHGSGPLELQIATEIMGSVRRAGNQVDALKFEGVRLDVAADFVRAALDVRRAYIAAVAAKRNAELSLDLKTAAEASAELSRRMARVGNWPRINEFKEAAALGEVSVQAGKTRQAAVAARERLTRLLGLSGELAAYKLPSVLAPLPSEPAASENPDSSVLVKRLDLRAQLFDIAAEVRDLEIEGFGDGALLTSARFVSLPGVMSLSGEITKDVRVPVYDLSVQSGSSRSADMMGSLTRLSSAVVQAEADLRESEMGRRTAYDIAAYQTREAVPLYVRMLDDATLRYNGMLIGVFDLLAAARARTTAEMAAAEALRDYWISAADSINALLVGGFVSTAAAAEVSPSGAPAQH